MTVSSGGTAGSDQTFSLTAAGAAQFGTGTIGANGGVEKVQIASGYGQIQIQSASGGNAIYRGYNSDGTETFTVRGSGEATFAGNMSINNGAIALYANGTVVSAGTYTTTSPNARTMYVGNDGTFGGVSSVRESKKNINYDYDSSWVLDLQPVSYNYRKQDEETKAYTEEAYEDGQYGLIAEDVEKVNREICNYDGDKLLGVEYMKLVTPMLSQLQTALTRIEALEARVQELEGGN